MHYLRTCVRPSPNGREGRSNTGSSSRRVEARDRRVSRGSRLIGAASRPRTTANFTATLRKLYK
jgi:hypothetical protein